jgi:hypothetical protein
MVRCHRVKRPTLYSNPKGPPMKRYLVTVPHVLLVEYAVTAATESEAINMAENHEGVVIDERIIGQCPHVECEAEEMEMEYEIP